jgi:recombination protein RecA
MKSSAIRPGQGGEEQIGSTFKQAEFEILYGEGISREGELIELGVAHNIIDKSGAWYTYKGDRIGQGKENVRQFLKDNPAMAAEIDARLRTELLPGSSAPATDDEVPADEDIDS